MVGFNFTIEENTGTSPGVTQSCAACGLYKNCNNPKMKPFGEFRKKVLFIGKMPGEVEDKTGKPWQGRNGRLLKQTLNKLNFDIYKDGLSLYACNCYPNEGKYPTPFQITCCRSKVLKAIKHHKPKVVILLGDDAIFSVIGNYWKKTIGSIHKWRGWNIPDRELKTWICPTYSPDYIWKNKEHTERLATLFFEKDIEKAFSCIDKPLPIEDEEKKIEYIETNRDLKRIIPELINTDLLSFDYETTGLKPHREGHKIVSVSACPSPDVVYTWLNNPIRQKLFKKVLKSGVNKTAHNLSFEETWSKVIFGTQVNNWKWCSMNNAHILDNRKGITGLKFQVYINFGVADYDSSISPYLQSDSKLGANAFNQIEKLIQEGRTKELLKYNALDSLFGYKLTKKQMDEI